MKHISHKQNGFFNYIKYLPILLILLATGTVRADKDPPFFLPKSSEISKLRTAVIYTDRGDLTFKLYPEEAPWHVANFKYRADKGLYKNIPFHIFYPGYVIQAGGPTKNPGASAAYTLPAEFNKHEHVFGALGMARRYDAANPERRSSGNQFHILLGHAPKMNGNYTVFGSLINGESVLESLEKGDIVKNVKVFVEP